MTFIDLNLTKGVINMNKKSRALSISLLMVLSLSSSALAEPVSSIPLNQDVSQDQTLSGFPSNQPIDNQNQKDAQLQNKISYDILPIEVKNGAGSIYEFEASKVFKFLPNPSGEEPLLQMDEIVFSKELDLMAMKLDIKKQEASTDINIKGELVAITPSIQQIYMDKEKAKQDLIMKVRYYDYTPYTPTFYFGEIPYRTTEDMQKINYILNEFSTSFNSKIKGRSENISIAAASIDGTILMPGQEFSFNKTLGPVSIANGYKYAPVIVDGEFVEGVGGGVCQVSTTLFNSALRSGLGITSRRNHSLPVAYVPKGTDATVATYVDLKFKNTLDNPVYIQAFVQDSKIIFRFYGSKDDEKQVKLSVTKTAERSYKLVRTINGKYFDSFSSTYREPKKTIR